MRNPLRAALRFLADLKSPVIVQGDLLDCEMSYGAMVIESQEIARLVPQRRAAIEAGMRRARRSSAMRRRRAAQGLAR